MKQLFLLEKGDIMYNPEYNGFHQIREIKEDAVVLSNCCNFMNDAKTVARNEEVAIDYLHKLKPVYKKKHKFMEWNKIVGAYEATSKKEKKAYLFHKDKCVIHSWNN